MRRFALVAAVLLLPTVAFVALRGAAAGATASTPNAASGTIPSFSHAFVIVGENTARGNMSPKDMPYPFGTLKPASAFVNNYYSFHVDRLAGELHRDDERSVHAVRGAERPARAVPPGLNNVFNQVHTHGRSWRTLGGVGHGPV